MFDVIGLHFEKSADCVLQYEAPIKLRISLLIGHSNPIKEANTICLYIDTSFVLTMAQILKIVLYFLGDLCVVVSVEVLNFLCVHIWSIYLLSCDCIFFSLTFSYFHKVKL